MNKLKYFLAFSIAFLIVGCPVRSVFSLFGEKDLVFNPSLLGTWMDTKSEDTYTFQKSGDKGYTVILREHKETGSKSESVTFKVQLGQLGKFWFLDSSPAGDSPDYHMMPTHLITKMSLVADTLRLVSLEADGLKKMIESGKLKIAHVNHDGDILLTGTTAELQEVVLRLAEDETVFPEPAGKLVRVK